MACQQQVNREILTCPDKCNVETAENTTKTRLNNKHEYIHSRLSREFQYSVEPTRYIFLAMLLHITYMINENFIKTGLSS
jgi:hypothetical protein